MSIEFPVATRHCRDMTEKLLKAMLNPNKQQSVCFPRTVMKVSVSGGASTAVGPPGFDRLNDIHVHKTSARLHRKFFMKHIHYFYFLSEFCLIIDFLSKHCARKFASLSVVTF